MTLPPRGVQCRYSATRYVSSPWEQQWLQNGRARQDSICSTMQKEAALSKIWMTAAHRINDLSFTASSIADVVQQANSTVFSHFEYSNSCGGEPLRVPIEPLVGLLRHPRVVQGCAALPGQPSMIDTRHDIDGEIARTHAPIHTSTHARTHARCITRAVLESSALTSILGLIDEAATCCWDVAIAKIII